VPEIAANLERAEESVQAARVLAAAGHCDFAASRAYYAAFYAATAALLCEGLEFSRHAGVIAAVHQQFVRTGKLDRQYGRDLNWLFELRSIGDYGETRHVPPDDADKAIAAAAAFLRAVKEMLGRS
jgi:uncharacterized protein (UPF0332 family)